MTMALSEYEQLRLVVMVAGAGIFLAGRPAAGSLSGQGRLTR